MASSESCVVIGLNSVSCSLSSSHTAAATTQVQKMYAITDLSDREDASGVWESIVSQS